MFIGGIPKEIEYERLYFRWGAANRMQRCPCSVYDCPRVQMVHQREAHFRFTEQVSANHLFATAFILLQYPTGRPASSYNSIV